MKWESQNEGTKIVIEKEYPVMTENFPNLPTNINLQIQEVPYTSKMIYKENRKLPGDLQPNITKFWETKV